MPKRQTHLFITEEGLKELADYKYKPGNYTKIDELLTPYWQWVVSYVPMWVAPNLITFIGWLFIIFSYVNILRYDYTFKEDIPNSCFLSAACCIWIYSTLDAIDGKQARRTKSSSPLGQLFDHGCDSFSLSFVILSLGQAAKLEGIQILILFLGAHFAFWTTTWMEYNTGIFQTSVGQFGITEAELTAVIVHLFSGIFGQNFWCIKVSYFLPQFLLNSQNGIWKLTHELQIGAFVAYYMGGLIITVSIYSFIKTIVLSKQKLKPIKQCLTFYIIVALLLVWYNLSFFEIYKGLVLLNFGIVFSLICCKCIISSVAKMPLPYFHQEIIPIIISTVAIISCEYFQIDHNIKQYIFWSSLGCNLFVILNFLVSVIKQITKHLNIHCFSLVKAKTQKVN